MKKGITAIAAFFFCIGVPLIHGQTPPKTEKQIPVYPGAVRDSAEERKMMADYEEFKAAAGNGFSDVAVTTKSVQVWNTQASPEEVFAFYAQKLAAKPGDGNGTNPFEMKANAATPACYSLTVWDPASDFEDQFEDHGSKLVDGKWMKSKIAGRKKTKDGYWVQSADFSWETRDNDNNVFSFSVSIDDQSFVDRTETYKQKTGILISVEKERLLTQEEMEQNRDAEDEEDYAGIEERAAFFRKNPPTEKSLGLPVYPGSKFNVEASAGMSSDDCMYYVYESADRPDAVLRYFEQKTGKKATALMEDSYLIAIRGSSPMPEEGIVIQPNTMFGGNSKTVITIQKMAE